MLLAGWLGSLSAQETLLQLQNGDRLTGTILRDDASTVVIDLPFVGTIDVPAAQIKRRQQVHVVSRAKSKTPADVAKTPTPAEVARKRQQLVELLTAQAQGKISAGDYLAQRLKILSEPFPAEPSVVRLSAAGVTNSAPAAASAPGPAAVKTVASVPVVTAAKPAPPNRKLWNFDAQVGANLQYNQRHNELYQGVFNVRYGDGQSRYRHQFNVIANRGRTDGLLSANNVNGLERAEVDVSKRVFFFNAFGMGYDEVRKIDLSYEDSLGVGYSVLKRPNLALSFDAGANYQEQFFADHTSKDYFSPRLGEKVTWKISSKFELNEAFEVFPRSLDLENYRLRLETTLRYSLTSYFSLNLRVADLHDTQPAPGVTPNDLQITSTLGVRF